MKKKFDFSAEMNEAEPIKSNPKNESQEEENRLLDLNIKELASLNDNVHEMSVNLENSLQFLQEYRLAIAKDTQEQTEKFGQTVLDKFLQQIQDKCNETERKISKTNKYISIPYTAFYILIIILVALSSFFVSIIVANAELLHSGLIWKIVIWTILIVVTEITIMVLLLKVLNKLKSILSVNYLKATSFESEKNIQTRCYLALYHSISKGRRFPSLNRSKSDWNSLS